MLVHRPDFRMLCVDPGLRGCGVAEFLGGNLVRAAYVKNPATGRGYVAHAMMGESVYDEFDYENYELVLIEHPRIYPGSAQQKGDLNDLIDVAAVGASVATKFMYCIESVFPSDWKGNVPADMMTARISRSITPDERAKIEKCPASLMHNVLDAAGLGLWKLGRLNKKVIHND